MEGVSPMAILQNINSPDSPSYILENQKRRLKEKEKCINDMKNEYELLERQTFELYKESLYYPFFNGVIQKSQKWLSMLEKEKIDKRKKYEEKTNYDMLTKDLEKFFKTTIKITEICVYNLGEAWWVYFTAHGHKWLIEIPVLDRINFYTYQRQGESCFKLTLSNCDKEHVISHVADTFDETELKDLLMNKGLGYCET